MQLTIRYCPQWGNVSTQTLTIDNNANVDLLQDLVCEKFGIPNKQQILRYKRDTITFKLLSGWSLSHYGISEKSVIVLDRTTDKSQDIDDSSDSTDVKVKGGYFLKLGIFQKSESVWEDPENCVSPATQPLDLSTALDLRSVGRFASADCGQSIKSCTPLFIRANASVTCEDAVEILIKEVKANNFKKVMEILGSTDIMSASIKRADDEEFEEEAIDIRAKKLINQRGISGWSAFHWSVYFDNIDMIAELLNLGAAINLHTDDGWTPLQLAVYKNHIEAVKLFVRYPSLNINEVSSRGTALHIAAKEGRIQMVSLLIKNGADPCVKSKEGDLPYDMAVNEKVKSLFEDLLLRTRAETVNTEDTGLVLVRGWVYKKSNYLRSFDRRYIVLNPWRGTLITYKKEKHYPNKPRMILPLIDYQNVRKKKAGAFFDKKMYYVQFELKDKKMVFGCHDENVVDQWISYIKKAAEYTIVTEKRIKFEITNSTNNFSILGSCIAKEGKSEEVILYDCKSPEFRNEENRRAESDFGKSTLKEQSFERQSMRPTQVPKEKLSLSSFEILKEIGSGSFGKVYKARKKDTGKVYALKTLHKRTLIMKDQLEYAISEANILKTVKHPFIINLEYTFQTQEHLFLALDYCPGGDLATYLCNCGTFFEDEARIIIAELILAIEHLHSLNILYRDLKPENILIGNDGHIRLTDFGLSKQNMLPGEVAKSFCGTPAYLAPEMLASRGVDRTVDLYGIGTVLYELLTGRPPYYSEDFGRLYQNITKGNLVFPPKMSKEVKHLLTKLLDKRPEKRLGAINMKELKSDPFFAKINWDKIFLRKQTPINIEIVEDKSESVLSLCRLKPLQYDVEYSEEKPVVNRVDNFSFAKSK